MAKNKIKLIKNKDGLGGPQYSVTYKANLRKCAGYRILSALAGDRDVVLTMSTDLIFGVDGKEERLFEEFLTRVKDRGLVYFNRTVPSQKEFTVFGLVLSRVKKNKKEAREIAVYVPNAVWRQEDFGPFLPTCGVQCYMCEAPMDPGETVRTILDMQEEQRAAVFVMDAYDIAQLGQIGINVRDMDEGELDRILASI